jgi:hypothetical protein
MSISLKDTQKILDKIRNQKDLRKFQELATKKYCKKYAILPSQFNFLISIVAAARAKENENI